MRASESEISPFFWFRCCLTTSAPRRKKIYGAEREKKKCSPPIALQHAGGRCTDTRVELLSEYKRLI